MSKDALILGSNLATLQAALDLADAGREVHLIDSSPFLDVHSASNLPPHVLNTRLLEIVRHPNIHVWANTRIARAEAEDGHFHIELRQLPRYVDLARCTACGKCTQVCPVSVSGAEHKAIYLEGQPGCAAIDKTGKPPCANTCPGGIHVQGYVALIAQGRFQEAIDLIRQAIPFPAICGRVCTHPCEFNCRRAEIDRPVAVRLLKRFVSDWELATQAAHPDAGASTPSLGGVVERNLPAVPFTASATGRAKVAVVGAGPGGMAVADRLARLGYPVTVFEKLPVIGGMMAVGIPAYRLPREVIAREYQHIQDLGVEIRLNTTIGPHGDYTLDDLFNMGYGAVCLAIGAHKSQSLHIPGEDLTGVVHGIDLLKVINLSQQSAVLCTADGAGYQADIQRWLQRGPETRVAVLGGGNTAMDVSRSLKRLGVKDVRILYRRTRKEMPAMPEEIEDVEQEGVQIEFLVSPVRVLGDEQNRVSGLECLRMKLGEPDASGRRRPVPIAGSEFVIALDLVALAIGQAPDFNTLGIGASQNQDIAITRDERINVADVSFMTSRTGVFAVGDAVTSDKMVVIEAIGMGKQAAAAIDAYLCGQPSYEVVVDSRQAPIARREMTADELVPVPRVPVPVIPMDQRLTSFTEIELGYTAEQASAEARRCLVCGPCSECQACVQVCQAGAIQHDQFETFTEMDIGAILDGTENVLARFPGLIQPGVRGVYAVSPEEALSGSAAAGRVLLDQATGGVSFTPRPFPVLRDSSPHLLADSDPARIGVFICQCGGEITGSPGNQVIDAESVRRHSADLPEVVYTQTLPFSCSPGATQAINTAIQVYNLNRVVLAACSCCSIDQVCYSCTYQRLRCKDNLGLFGGRSKSGVLDAVPKAAQRVAFELVNIREQCAWVHANDPLTATALAASLVTAAVARSRAALPRPAQARSIEPATAPNAALIMGSGAAASTCQSAIENLGRPLFPVQRLDGLPDQVTRSNGRYVVLQNEHTWQAAVLVLAPSDNREVARLLAAFGREGLRPRVSPHWGGLDTHRPGVYFCDPALDPVTVGAAVAARSAAWLNRTASRPAIVAVVDPSRCRACSTCVKTCDFGAPGLIVTEIPSTGLPGSSHRKRISSWIDPAICTNCGTCAARCPSGAITAGYSSNEQIEAAISALLAFPGGIEQRYGTDHRSKGDSPHDLP